MDILLAIDLHDGQVVRQGHGNEAAVTYSADPAAIADTCAAAGARWLHVVDLDAARSGVLKNLPALRAIRQAVDVHIEFGGGLHDDSSVEIVLGMGVDRVVIGSAALADMRWFEQLVRRDDLAERVTLALDARGGKLLLRHRTESIDLTACDIAREVRYWPLGAIVYIDVSRDGTLEGVGLDDLQRLISVTDVPVIAGGGVASLADVRACKSIGCDGVIVSRAYYDKKLDLAEACRAAEEAL
ncbi:MAG: 1-(5-phosphoribosyl)-5-[(5-phosphoribosylamino)methylideneamino]imidazole-4-carboxamide isomerase [Planctomycetota bacterium]|jgi:phosphoribosylformimino-5-aminoimidazole carboxamide ribotide isomerase